MNLISRGITIFFLIILTTSLLTSCTSRTPTPTKVLTLHMGFLPAPSALPFFVMESQKFGKQNGLQFVGVPSQSAEAIIASMASGLVDVGYVSSAVILFAQERGLIPGKVVPVALLATGCAQ